MANGRSPVNMRVALFIGRFLMSMVMKNEPDSPSISGRDKEDKDKQKVKKEKNKKKRGKKGTGSLV